MCSTHLILLDLITRIIFGDEYLLAPIRATFPASLIDLDLITRITFGEQYES
jgi:hypothetical protein